MSFTLLRSGFVFVLECFEKFAGAIAVLVRFQVPEIEVDGLE
jgi:hypothetical protein